MQYLPNFTYIKANFKLIDIYHKAFNEIKTIVLQNTLLCYPSLNKQPYINIYDGYYQLGLEMSLEGKPIYLYIRKLNIP